MTNEITQKFIDLLGPVKDDRLHFATYKSTAAVGGYNVVEMSKVQRELAEQILKDHFKFKEVNWIQASRYFDGESKKIKPVFTTKLGDDDATYEGKTAHIYQIAFTPRMYDPKTLHNAVKDGCAITPLLYNPETFIPYRKVVLEYCPEYTVEFPAQADMKQHLRDKLERVLQNPDEYMQEGLRGVMVRMVVV